MWYFCRGTSLFHVKICELPAVPIRYRIFDFWERVRARKGGLSRDNVLSPGERCWKCSLLNSLSTHIKTKCLYTRCYGSSRTLAAIFIFSVVSFHLVPVLFSRTIGSVLRANYSFPVTREFGIWAHSIFTSRATLTSPNCRSSLQLWIIYAGFPPPSPLFYISWNLFNLFHMYMREIFEKFEVSAQLQE